MLGIRISAIIHSTGRARNRKEAETNLKDNLSFIKFSIEDEIARVLIPDPKEN